MPFILLSIGFLLGFGFALYVERSRNREKRLDLERFEREVEEEQLLMEACQNQCPDRASAFEEFNQKVSALVASRKEKLLEQLEKRERLSSTQVAELLEVSQRTALRYLLELVEAKKVTQGGSGRATRYSLAPKNLANP